ncbi:BMP family lipoprotein [Salibacterium qingdaonense]|uniref:Nucleoside-binding protein n=1 Tax=Salibacterium qingdaonense TaxID=266892 RepID=A0A1I4QQ60_9BACI|nr:BMP family ABC transporter substrate-binding protein [Salibacterium qingdaonense]SFM41865.1 nucleoside-binding protein [Salibacterium qingdaonense]
MKNKHLYIMVIMLMSVLSLAACGQEQEINATEGKKKVGVMMSDSGLGDQSFNDLAFEGLVRARDNLDVVFDYREIAETETYEQGIRELVEQDNDLVIGIGYQLQEALETVAGDYPDQQFLIIDSVSEMENITSVNFKVGQASHLAGMTAAMTTETDHIGFIGGQDVEIINNFYNGFEEGAKAANPDIVIDREYAGTYEDDQLGADMADDMIQNGADIIFAAAGFTGVGALQEAQAQGVYGIGVDTDQYFQAEDAVITSVMKNVDNAIYQVIERMADGETLSGENLEYGLAEEWVGLAPLRVADFPDNLNEQLDAARDELAGES